MSTTGSATPSRPSSVVSEASSVMPPEKNPDEGSKLKIFITILKKFFNVSDLAAVRFSLPAQLLEPRPNLDYWMYLDRPETFTAIGDSEDELGRMIAALRFWYTKDLKYVKGRPCKPYNSVLGEFFRCSYDVENNLPVIYEAGSKMPATEKKEKAEKAKVLYLTEQTSHHPPISAWYAKCPEKGISAKGYDQLSGNFTGTRIKVTPGGYNLGIFVTLENRENEEYQMTHPTAYLGGIFRGNLSVTVADQCFITCPKTRLKTILHYVEEGWLGKTQNRMYGVVFKYDPDNDNMKDIKKVPESEILCKLEGNWTEKIYFTLPGEKEKTLLIDLAPLEVTKKDLPPDEDQLPNESFQFWAKLTDAIKTKRFGEANDIKHRLEERQRKIASNRTEKGVTWEPRFFSEPTSADGKPSLSQEGEAVMSGLEKKDYKLAELPDPAAEGVEAV